MRSYSICLSLYYCTKHNTLQVHLKVKVKSLSRVQLFATSWTVAYQAPLSMGFSRQEYWSGLPFPSPGDLPDAGIEPRSPTSLTDALPSEPPGKSKATYIVANGKIFFLSHCWIILHCVCMYGVCVCVYIHIYIFFIHSSNDGHLSWFHILAIKNSTIMYMGVPIFLREWFRFLWIHTQKWNCQIIQ